MRRTSYSGAMRLWAILAVALAFGAGFARGEDKLSKIDRSRVIGTPVLESAPRGIHVWLEDGWYRVAAVSALPVGSQKKMRRSFGVTVRSTKVIKAIELDEWKRSGGTEQILVLRVSAGPEPEIMRFKTDGDLMISAATMEEAGVAIFLGPLSKRAASTVTVGRY